MNVWTAFKKCPSINTASTFQIKFLPWIIPWQLISSTSDLFLCCCWGFHLRSHSILELACSAFPPPLLLGNNRMKNRVVVYFGQSLCQDCQDQLISWREHFCSFQTVVIFFRFSSKKTLISYNQRRLEH